MPIDLLRPFRRAPLTVTILGSAGTFPHADNPCSGYLVRTPTTTVWVDTGPGTFSALLEHVTLAEVDAIVVSHEHPDHWTDLPVVRNAAKYVLGIERIALHGTAGTRRLLEGVLGGGIDPFDWTDITDGSAFDVGDVRISCSVTNHPVETLGLRLEAADRVLAYSADTGPGWSFAALDPTGVGFDLALCEATLAEHEAGPTQHHLTASQAGAMADAAGVRRLAITHLLDDTSADRADAASGAEAFDGPVEVAAPGTTYTV